MKKTSVLIFLILLLAASLRFFRLWEVPSGVTNDEAQVIYTGYSIWQTHRDINGKFLPLSFNIDNSFSPIAIYLLAPVVGIFGVSSFTGRFLFAFLGVISVFLVFLIAKKIFGNFYIAVISMFVMAVSPWHLQFSRSAYEVSVALFFYLLAIYVFLNMLKTGKFWMSLPFFLLGFYSYHATKIFLIFYIPLLLFIYKDQILKFKRSLLLFLLGMVCIGASFIYIAKTQNVTRGGVLLFNDSKSAVKLVDLERTLTEPTVPLPMRSIFNNKFLYFLRIMRENYMEAFSPQFLFLYGETSGLAGIYGTYFRGELYFIEFVFLILGVFYTVSQKDTKAMVFLISSLLIAPLPSALAVDKSYSSRSMMMLPFLAILIGCGIYCLISYCRKDNAIFRKLLLLSIGSIYAFQIVSYVYQYQFRYSIYGAEPWFRSSKDVVQFIAKNKNKYDNVYIVNKGDLLMQYAFFNQLDPKLTSRLYIVNKPITIDNVHFIRECLDTREAIFTPLKFLAKHTLYITPDACHKKAEPQKAIVDRGEPLRTIWKIFERGE